MPFHEARFRVRYAETDQMGVVYHSHYITWMEIGRVELCRSRGVRYRDMEEQDGIILAVVDVQCRYVSPARYDDEVIVRASIDKAQTRLVRFRYEILEACENRVLAHGTSTHVFLDKALKPSKLPPKYHALFGIER
ncbi:MAG: thioesterase family protein [Bryobacteraceae bacterium]|nr:thioesterase family protein [Bryobacteraceae bacterium]